MARKPDFVFTDLRCPYCNRNVRSKSSSSADVVDGRVGAAVRKCVHCHSQVCLDSSPDDESSGRELVRTWSFVPEGERKNPDKEYAKALAEYRGLVKEMGLGFHPDTRAESYRPRLSKEKQRRYTRILDAAAKYLPDEYAEALKVWEELGWINKDGSSPSARKNPGGIDALSWPMAWHTGKTTKAAFKEHCKKLEGRCDVSVWGDGKPGTLIDLPPGRYVVYGGTSNPNRSPAKWYANVAVSPSGVTIT